MKRFTFLVFVTFLCNTISAQDTVVYTLQKCIDWALKNNLAMIMSENDIETSKAYLQQSRASMLPTLSAYANQGMNAGKTINPYTNTFINQEVNTGQYGINGSLNLFNGLSGLNTMRQQANGYAAAKLDMEQLKLDLVIMITDAYLQICSNQEWYKQALQEQEVTQLQLLRLKTLEQNDALSPSVLYDVKGQLATDKLNLITARASLQTVKLNLAQLLNTNFSPTSKFENVEIQTVEYNANTTENSINAGIKSNPAINSAAYKSKSAHKNLVSSYGQIFPSLSLNGSVGSNYSSAAFTQQLSGVQNITTDAYINVAGVNTFVVQPQSVFQSDKISFNDQLNNNLNSYIGLSLQIPLFNGFKNRTQIKLAQLNYEEKQEQEKNTIVKFKNQTEQALLNLQNAIETYTILKEQVGDYTESFRIATSKFEKGMLTTLEYMTAKSNLTKAQANLNAAHYNCILKQKVVAVYSQGKI
jgi:outer membrane protein